jgi:hypothetical protein
MSGFAQLGKEQGQHELLEAKVKPTILFYQEF